MSDDPMPASFVWTGDDDEMQKVPDGPALGNYPAGLSELQRQYHDQCRYWMESASQRDRRATVGEKLARFLNDLADSVRGWH